MLNEILLFVITGIIGFLAAIIKKSFVTFGNKFKNCELANQNLLRGQIVDIYYSYKKAKKIPFYQKEVANECHEAYAKNGGNSFVEDLIKEINSWEII